LCGNVNATLGGNDLGLTVKPVLAYSACSASFVIMATAPTLFKKVYLSIK
jgi:hypothetical protein